MDQEKIVVPNCDECKFQEKIDLTYMMLVTGDGQNVRPMSARLYDLEAHMAESIPILKHLEDNATRQDIRDQDRLDAEKKAALAYERRAKKWDRFREAVIAIAAIVGMIYSAQLISDHMKKSNIKIPTLFFDAPLKMPEYANSKPRVSTDAPSDNPLPDMNPQ